jgi:DnaJ-class molecular chaperone
MTCPTCRGSEVDLHGRPCRDCDGTGHVRRDFLRPQTLQLSAAELHDIFTREADVTLHRKAA